MPCLQFRWSAGCMVENLMRSSGEGLLSHINRLFGVTVTARRSACVAEWALATSWLFRTAFWRLFPFVRGMEVGLRPLNVMKSPCGNDRPVGEATLRGSWTHSRAVGTRNLTRVEGHSVAKMNVWGLFLYNRFNHWECSHFKNKETSGLGSVREGEKRLGAREEDKTCLPACGLTSRRFRNAPWRSD